MHNLLPPLNNLSSDLGLLFMTRVDPGVYLQVTCLCERLSTHITSKRLLTSVDPLVCLQGASLGKRLAANVTNKRLLTSVEPVSYTHLTLPTMAVV